jgi:hypothetical protein
MAVWLPGIRQLFSALGAALFIASPSVAKEDDRTTDAG